MSPVALIILLVLLMPTACACKKLPAFYEYNPETGDYEAKYDANL